MCYALYGCFILPGIALANVKSVESLATKQEVKSKLASFLCSLASVFSNSSCSVELPAMFLVPPAPVPYFSNASLKERQFK